MCLGYVPISSSAPRPLGAAYVLILLSEVEQEQRPSGSGDREAVVAGAGLCDGEGERAYTAYAPHYDIFAPRFKLIPGVNSKTSSYDLISFMIHRVLSI